MQIKIWLFFWNPYGLFSLFKLNKYIKILVWTRKKSNEIQMNFFVFAPYK